MLAPGLTAEKSRVVAEEDSAARVSPLVPPVLASARMIGFMEIVCAELMAPHLAPNEGSVGVGFHLTHESPTPIGMRASIKATVKSVEGRIVTFEVEGRDEVDRICRGTHERAIILKEKFLARLAEKAKKIAR
jgi:fluoroacetyl-CoA thioesterase